LVIVEADPWESFPDRPRLQAALKLLDHLVVLDYVDSPLGQAADCFIPTRTIYETGGHWINQEGRVQAALPIMDGGDPIAITGKGDHPPRVFGKHIPGGEPMAAWRALAELTETISTTDQANDVLDTALHYFHKGLILPLNDSTDRRIDLDAVAQLPAAVSIPPDANDDSIVLFMVERTFGTEPLASTAPALGKLGPPPMAAMHPETLAALGAESAATVTIAFNGEILTVPVAAEPDMAPGVLAVPRHHQWAWQVVGKTPTILNRAQITIDTQPSSVK
jgi:NADH-quinone oxidoreductase subunit G